MRDQKISLAQRVEFLDFDLFAEKRFSPKESAGFPSNASESVQLFFIPFDWAKCLFEHITNVMLVESRYSELRKPPPAGQKLLHQPLLKADLGGDQVAQLSNAAIP